MTTLLKPINPGRDADFQPPADGWIHVSPHGLYPDTLDDGTTVYICITPASCADQVAAYKAEALEAGDAWAGMLVDFDHFSLDTRQSSEASGWAEDLEARPDGLWARIRWTDSGLAAIRGGRFRFASPVHWPHDCHIEGDTYTPFRLDRLALTNDPRMLKGRTRMRPISSRAAPQGPHASSTNHPTTKTDMDYKQILTGLLGLPAEATDDQITAAAAARQEADATAAAALAEKTREVEALTARVEEAENQLASRQADDDLDTLEKEGYTFTSRDNVRKAIIADRETFLAGLRAVRPARAAGTPPAEPLRSRAAAAVPRAGSPATRDEAIHAEQVLNGFTRRADAVASAQRKYPHLWK